MHAVQTEPVVATSEHNSSLHLWPRLLRRFSTQEGMKSCMRESCGALIPAHIFTRLHSREVLRLHGCVRGGDSPCPLERGHSQS